MSCVSDRGYVFDRDKDLHEQAAKAFSRHVIRQQGDGRWLLQRPYDDARGGWDSIYWTEVVSLAGGYLYVGGDIGFVIFGRYGDTRAHEDKVRWMGNHDDFGYYVHQKATIGTGRQLIDVYDPEAAQERLREWRQERVDNLKEEHAFDFDENEDAFKKELADKIDGDELIDTIDDLLRWGEDSPDVALERLHRANPCFMDDRYDLGIVIAPRLHYAYAALRRLCALLDEEAAVAKVAAS